MNTHEEVEINLLDIFYLLRSKLWLIIMFALLTASAAGLFSYYMRTPMYTSTTQLYIINRSSESTSLSDIQMLYGACQEQSCGKQGY